MKQLTKVLKQALNTVEGELTVFCGTPSAGALEEVEGFLEQAIALVPKPETIYMVVSTSDGYVSSRFFKEEPRALGALNEAEEVECGELVTFSCIGLTDIEFSDNDYSKCSLCHNFSSDLDDGSNRCVCCEEAVLNGIAYRDKTAGYHLVPYSDGTCGVFDVTNNNHTTMPQDRIDRIVEAGDLVKVTE